MDAKERIGLAFLILAWLFLGQSPKLQTARAANTAPDSFEAKAAEVWSQLPPARTHFEGVPEGEPASRRRREENYQTFLREKMQGKWFAALTAAAPDEAFSIQRPFGSWKELMDFLVENEALVEAWAYPEGGEPARRVPATERTELKKQKREQPAFITIPDR